MGRDWYLDILMFHWALGSVVNSKPVIPDECTQELRSSLVEEEYNELMYALSRGDLPRLLMELQTSL